MSEKKQACEGELKLHRHRHLLRYQKNFQIIMLRMNLRKRVRKETGLRRRTQASSSSSFAPLPREFPDHHAPHESEENPEEATSSAADGAAGRRAADGAANGAAGRSAADGAAETSSAAADAERAASYEVAPRPADNQVGSSNDLPRLARFSPVVCHTNRHQVSPPKIMLWS